MEVSFSGDDFLWLNGERKRKECLFIIIFMKLRQALKNQNINNKLYSSLNVNNN